MISPDEFLAVVLTRLLLRFIEISTE